jgi:chromosome segregation ATPase
MSELENEENIKNTIQDTQMLIRNHMQQHKKISKQLHGQIKKDKKTIELFKEKIAKLILEKKKLEEKQHLKGDLDQTDTPQIQDLKIQIKNEVEEKKSFDDKIADIQNEFLVIKNEMGGLNATQALKERYEKHIRILENRLDKANQKFNDAIEYDKNLRNEIDKLRKERFFFENIYKKLEKELEKLRKDISKNLEEAYDNYEQRDLNQENFENLKAEMIKKETEYTNILSGIANEMNIRNTRKKAQEKKELKSFQLNEDNSIPSKKYTRKLKTEQFAQQQQNLYDRYQNLKFKFEKMMEFTNKKDIEDLCETFKKNVQENFDLFLSITMISNEAKKVDSEIKEMQEEINRFKQYKNRELEKENEELIKELQAKTRNLMEKQKEYDDETKKYLEQFKEIKGHVEILFDSLNCKNEMTDEEQIMFMGGISENNIMGVFAQIEKKLKYNEKILEHCLSGDEENIPGNKNESLGGITTKQVNDNMKMAFANMDINKIKTMEKTKNNQNPEDFKLENLINYSKDIAFEVMNNINKSNQTDKKGSNKANRKGNKQ